MLVRYGILIKFILTAIFVMPTYFQQAHGEEARSKTNARDITPPGVTRVFRSSEAPADSDDGLPKFADIHVLTNGILRSQAVTIRLYGVVFPNHNMICTYRSGGRWACGVMAFIALRNLLESRSILCDIKDGTEQNMVGQCNVDRIDISVWLLQEGWVSLEAGTTEKRYLDAFDSAKARGVGLWREESVGQR